VGSSTADAERYVKEDSAHVVSMYSDFVRGTWREGSYTEDSARRVIEGSGNGVFLFYRGSMMVN
jgi:hypothetical protein